MGQKPESKSAYPGCLALNASDFQYLCRLSWHELTPDPEKPNVRHCQQCDKSVHVCQSMEALKQHAQAGHCVALYSEPELPASETNPVRYFGRVDSRWDVKYIVGPPLTWD